MKFSDLSIGAEFRYITNGTVWVKTHYGRARKRSERRSIYVDRSRTVINF